MLDFYERGAHSRMVILFFIFLDFKEHITQAEVNLLLRSRVNRWPTYASIAKWLAEVWASYCDSLAREMLSCLLGF